MEWGQLGRECVTLRRSHTVLVQTWFASVLPRAPPPRRLLVRAPGFAFARQPESCCLLAAFSSLICGELGHVSHADV